MWGWLCGTVVLVCATSGSGGYLYNPFLVCLLFFCLYRPYILLISSEIFFVLLVCVLFLAVLQVILHIFIISQNSIVFSSVFQSCPIFLYKILSILIYFPSNLCALLFIFSYLPPCYSTLPPSTLLVRGPNLYCFLSSLFVSVYVYIYI